MNPKHYLLVAAMGLSFMACKTDDNAQPDGHLFKVTVKDASNNQHPNLDIGVNIDGFEVTTFTDDIPGRYEYYYYFDEHGSPTNEEVRFYAQDGPLIGRSERLPMAQYTDARVFDEEIILYAPGTLNIVIDNNNSSRSIIVYVEDLQDPNHTQHDLSSSINYLIDTTIVQQCYGEEQYDVSWAIYDSGLLDSTGATSFFMPAGGTFNLDLNY